MRGSKAFLIPAIGLSTLGTWLSGLGLFDLWGKESRTDWVLPIALAFCALIHSAWLLAAARRESPFTLLMAWSASLSLARAGLATAGLTSPFVPAVVLEMAALGLALSVRPRSSWGERFARWRRARQRITTEVQSGDGVVSWLASSGRRLLLGKASRPISDSFDRLSLELSDVERRLEMRLTGASLPQQTHQLILTCARGVVSRAELATAQAAIAMEQDALREAAAVVDRIVTLQDVPEDVREAMARECEALMLSLIERHPPRPLAWTLPAAGNAPASVSREM